MTWRRMTTSENQLAWIWGGLAVATAVLTPVWVWVAPFLRPCLFRRVTGVPCPSCGATRGVLALFDGRPVDALGHNPLMVLLVIAFGVGGILAPVWARTVGVLPEIRHPLPGWIRLGIVAVIIVNWVWVIAVH